MRATLVGLGLPIPIAVSTVSDSVRDLHAGDDDGTVLTALAVWDDLVEGRSVVGDLVGLVDVHLADLRAAQDVTARSPVGLPDELAAQHDELKDLLEAGDLAGKLGRITAITSTITSHRAKRLAELRVELVERMEEERAALRAKYPSVDPDAMAEAMASLEQLVQNDGDDVGTELLEARLAAIQSTATDVAHVLDVIVAKDRLATVPIGEIAPDLIRTPDELTVVLERLQKRVAELLGDDKEVRLT